MHQKDSVGALPPRGEERGWPAWLGLAALAVAFVVAQVVVGVLMAVTGAEADALPAAVSLAAALVQEATFVGAALLFASFFARPHPWQFGLRATPFWPAVGSVAAGLVCFYVLSTIYVAAAGSPEQSTADDVGADDTRLATIGAGVLFVFIAPVAEEFLFRGFLYRALRNRLAPHAAALVGGVVFGSLHVFTGLEAVPLLIILGVILCLVYERTGSLYPCIAIHAINNALAYGGETDASPALALAFGAVMLGVCALAPRYVWRQRPQREAVAAGR